MVIGNFALLAGLNPAAVHGWYLGVYIDAFEWVELPHTVGMSQFADGGRNSGRDRGFVGSLADGLVGWRSMASCLPRITSGIAAALHLAASQAVTAAKRFQTSSRSCTVASISSPAGPGAVPRPPGWPMAAKNCTPLGIIEPGTPKKARQTAGFCIPGRRQVS
jgi:hypothetical protein